MTDRSIFHRMSLFYYISSSVFFHPSGRKEILHGINGRLQAKQLIALMGPSGAGKSTLLDVLSGFRETGVDGVIYVNGRIRQLNSFRRLDIFYIFSNWINSFILYLIKNQVDETIEY